MFRPSAAKLSFNLVPAGNHPTNVSLHSRTKGRIMIHFVGKLMRHTGLASPSQAHTSPSLPGQPEAQTRSTTAQVPSCDKLPHAISGPRYRNPQALHCVTSRLALQLCHKQCLWKGDSARCMYALDSPLPQQQLHRPAALQVVPGGTVYLCSPPRFAAFQVATTTSPGHRACGTLDHDMNY